MNVQLLTNRDWTDSLPMPVALRGPDQGTMWDLLRPELALSIYTYPHNADIDAPDAGDFRLSVRLRVRETCVMMYEISRGMRLGSRELRASPSGLHSPGRAKEEGDDFSSRALHSFWDPSQRRIRYD